MYTGNCRRYFSLSCSFYHRAQHRVRVCAAAALDGGRDVPVKPQERALAKFHADESDCVYGAAGEERRRRRRRWKECRGPFAIKLYQIRD